MKFRPYTSQDQADCLAIFDSNCPPFFDPAERELFAKYLDHQDHSNGYTSPTYQNVSHENYAVIEDNHSRVVACGGFYISTSPVEARLAWGMVDQKCHGQGIGRMLFHERWELIKRDFTGVPLTLGTSQFTSAFYAKMGFEITSVIPDGYGKGIDQVNMIFHP